MTGAEGGCSGKAPTKAGPADPSGPDQPKALGMTERRIPRAPAAEGPRDDERRLSRWNDPQGVYAHCLCGEE